MKNRLFALTFYSFLFLGVGSLGLATGGHAQNKQSTPTNQSGALSAAQKKEVQKIIGIYLRDNPEIVVESIRILQQRERQEEKERGLKNLVTYREQIVNDPTSPVGGNPNGDVTIVEFFDYNCGYCKRVFPTIKKLLAEDKNIRYVFKEFPILSPASELAARAALAAWRQDKSKYVQLHTAFIQLRGGFTESRIMRIAGKIGLNTAKLKTDMRSPAITKIIADNRALAQNLGITGTPGFVIGNQIVPGAVDMTTLKDLVATARKG